jgi:purine-binding chemotaxis protein CheW
MPSSATLPVQTEAKRHFLTFRLEDRLYALPAEDVAEVIRIPAMARMPQSPKGLLGLANLRGTILPIASGRGLVGQPKESDAVHGRAIVMNGVSPVAFAVDAVDALVAIEGSAVETHPTKIAALSGEVLTGAFRSDKDGPIVKVLDIKTLLNATFMARERPQRRLKQTADKSSAVAGVDAPSAQSKLVTFTVAGQEYALPLEIVQEIVAAPALLANVPHAEALVLGVASLRDTLLPLLSLRGLLGFGANPEPAKEKVVVAIVQGNLVGLVVDEMRTIFAADETRMDPMPEVLAARTGGESRIASIYRKHDGSGLVSILSATQIFGDDVMQRLTDARKDAELHDPSVTAAAEAQKYLVFKLGDEEFGLPIDAVEEVARVPDKVARVPHTPKFLEGVVNLRGNVIPVVDQRKRFQLPPLAEAKSRRLIVVRTERHIAGLIVDSVSEVLRPTVDDIDVAPDLTGESTRLVAGVVNLESQKRIILLLDPAELLTRAERGILDKFAQRSTTPEQSGT